jgi:hypothetical protein
VRQNWRVHPLGRDGCTLHDRAPAICPAFDCRDLFLSKTRAERLAMDPSYEDESMEAAKLDPPIKSLIGQIGHGLE